MIDLEDTKNPKEKNNEVVNGVLFGLLIVILIFGLIQIKDYGLSFDEGTELNTMLKTYSYAEGVTSHLLSGSEWTDESDYMSYADNIYGVAVRYPVYLIIKEMELGFRETFLLLHFYTYLWFTAAVLALYFLLKSFHYSKTVRIIGCIIFCLSPRIFAESAYNIKDVMFLALFLITMTAGVVALKKRKFRYLLFFSFLTALSINTRCIGGIILLPVVLLYGKENYAQNKKLLPAIGKAVGICFMTYACFYFVTPYIWTNPITNTMTILKSFRDYSDGVMEMIFNGKHYLSNQLPWYYLIEWMVITTPILTLILFCIGGWRTVKEITEIVLKHRKSKVEKLYENSLVIIFIMILVLDGILQPVKYDGWRHFYFMYGLGFVITVKGIDFLWSVIQKQKRIIQIGSLGVIGIAMGITAGWMIQNHPYGYVYFNEIARIYEKDNFERDYWFVSTYDAMEEILQINKQDNIKIFCLCRTSMYLLTDQERQRITFTDLPGEAQYIILQYRNAGIDETKGLIDNQSMISEKTVDGLPIYTIYYAQ